MEFVVVIGNKVYKLKSEVRAYTMYNDAGLDVNKMLLKEDLTSGHYNLIKRHLGNVNRKV